MTDEIRTVDIGEIGLQVPDPGEDVLTKIGHHIVQTFQLTGFTYLKNHGLSNSIQKSAFSTARQFFDQPMDFKMEYERFSRCGYNGYTPPGAENTGFANNESTASDRKECFDLCVIEKASDWPSVFDTSVRQLTESCWRLVIRLLQSIDLALEAGGQLVGAHSQLLNIGSFSTLRLLNYPSVEKNLTDGETDMTYGDEHNDCTRCAAHTDYGTMTVLIQESQPGLEVETSPGHWTPALPVPDTLLINIGDMMEIWTSGRLKATLHRVINPKPIRQSKCERRQSIAFFVHPNNGVIVSPLDGNHSIYKSVVPSDFVRRKFSLTYPNYSRWLQQEQDTGD